MSETLVSDSDSLKRYEFFSRIGSPKRIVAPMVDQSDLAFRMMTRKYGADLVYTQMYNANSFITSIEYREDNFRTCEADRPLIIQFAGHDPQALLKAAKYVEHLCDAVDINLGCPQGIAKRGRYGAFLMEELELLHDIVSTLVQGLKVPVTCKTRIYKDFDTSIRLCETLVNAGASLLTIHGRTRDEKGQAVKEADWDMIRRIKQHFGSRVPIIANGGISCADDITRCLEVTGADGVMTSEGILENPTLFTSNVCPSTNKRLSQIDIAEEYLELCKKYPAHHMKTVRSHIMKFLFRYHSKHDDLREKIVQAHTIEEFEDICKYCRSIVGDREESYEVPWYMRYRVGMDNIDSAQHRHDEPTNKCRPANSFLGDEPWDCSENDPVKSEAEDLSIFDGLGMFQ